MMKQRWRVAQVACFELCGLDAGASQLKVAVSLREPSPQALNAVWTLRQAGTPEAPPIKLPLQVPGQGGIDLPAGPWIIQLDVPGYWHPPRVVTLADREQTLEFRLWRTTRIAGRFEVPKGEGSPKSVSVRFQSAPSHEGDRLPVTEIACPVAGNAK